MRQLYKQQLQNSVLKFATEGKGMRGTFEGVEGRSGMQGELFGIENLFQFSYSSILQDMRSRYAAEGVGAIRRRRRTAATAAGGTAAEEEPQRAAAASQIEQEEKEEGSEAQLRAQLTFGNLLRNRDAEKVMEEVIEEAALLADDTGDTQRPDYSLLSQIKTEKNGHGSSSSSSSSGGANRRDGSSSSGTAITDASLEILKNIGMNLKVRQNVY